MTSEGPSTTQRDLSTVYRALPGSRFSTTAAGLWTVTTTSSDGRSATGVPGPAAPGTGRRYPYCPSVDGAVTCVVAAFGVAGAPPAPVARSPKVNVPSALAVT